MGTDTESVSPFCLLNADGQSSQPPQGPNGDTDLLSHFKIKNIHVAVVNREPANYLKNAPGYPAKTRLYKKDTHSLMPFALRPQSDVKIVPFPASYLKGSLILLGKSSELSDDAKGVLVQGEGWETPELGTPSRENTHTKDSSNGLTKDSSKDSKEASTKIRFTFGVVGDKNKADKKRKKKEKKEKKEKKAKKDKKDKK